MEFKDITAISGMGGLFAMVHARPDGMVVKHLDSNRTQFVSNRIHTFSPLDKIGIFSGGDTVDLLEVMLLMLKDETEDNGKIPDAKGSSKEQKDYFRRILPEYEEERVYVSDIKKAIKWYKILKEHDLIHPAKENTSDEADSESSSEEAAVDATPTE